MTKLEEVVRALYEKRYVSRPGTSAVLFGAIIPWSEFKAKTESGIIVRFLYDELMEEARAAVEALREPTEAMCDAGGRFISKRGSHLPEDLARTAFGSMIDVILSEAKEPPP